MLAWVWVKRNIYFLLVGVKTVTITMKISAELPQKAKNRHVTQSSSTTHVNTSKGLYIICCRDSCEYMIIVILFMIPRKWKQPKCLSADEWIMTIWYIYAMEHYSVVKKNKIFKFSGNCMKQGTIILNKVI